MKDTHENIEVVAHDLRALLFWAGIGISNSYAGSYQYDIEEIIRSYSSFLGIKTKLPKFKKPNK